MMDNYRFEAHKPVKIKWLPWCMCSYCGLVYLRNRFTAWAIKKGCNNADHPEYQQFLNNTRELIK